MGSKWFNKEKNWDKVVLAGDIGGTNTNLALVGLRQGNYTILMESVFQSAKIESIIDPVKEVVEEGKVSGVTPSLCCISAAGAVENNFCSLTNCSWDIDGNQIKEETGLDTVIINDFMAISYGIPTLDTENPEQILPLKHSDGSLPSPESAAKAVVGPGTGLGVSYIAHHNGEYIPCPSEGGHTLFSDFDEETRSLKEFMRKKLGKKPGTEPFVSGQGISNIFDYYLQEKGISAEGIIKEIQSAPAEDRPALISKHSQENQVCREIMEMFGKMFASFASDIAALFLPLGGLYIAGGIVIKNQDLLIKDNLFMSIFEDNYNPNLVPILKKIPVFIIKDYSISLYGAANAAVRILG